MGGWPTLSIDPGSRECPVLVGSFTTEPSLSLSIYAVPQQLANAVRTTVEVSDYPLCFIWNKTDAFQLSTVIVIKTPEAR